MALNLTPSMLRVFPYRSWYRQPMVLVGLMSHESTVFCLQTQDSDHTPHTVALIYDIVGMWAVANRTTTEISAIS